MPTDDDQLADYLGRAFGLSGTCSLTRIEQFALHRTHWILSDGAESLLLKRPDWFERSKYTETAGEVIADLYFHIRVQALGAETTTPRLTTAKQAYVGVPTDGPLPDTPHGPYDFDFHAYTATVLEPGKCLATADVSPDRIEGILWTRGHFAALCARANIGMGPQSTFPNNSQAWWNSQLEKAAANGASWVTRLSDLMPSISRAVDALPPVEGRYVRPLDMFPSDFMLTDDGRCVFTDWHGIHLHQRVNEQQEEDSLGGLVAGRRIDDPDESERQVWTDWARARGFTGDATAIIRHAYQSGLKRWNLPTRPAVDHNLEQLRRPIASIAHSMTSFVGYSNATGILRKMLTDERQMLSALDEFSNALAEARPQLRGLVELGA